MPGAAPAAAAARSWEGGVATEPSVAVLVPCYNEAVSIAGVVREFRAALPRATIYVYDNNSTDGTAERAREAGAEVRAERLQGKGHVVRRMFADVEADVYVLVDGDGTYRGEDAARLVRLLLAGRLDLVNGRRVTDLAAAYRPGHRLGNRMLTGLVRRIFGNRFADMLSGLKVFSRRYAKSFPGLSQGFEIETELTIHALELDMAVDEADIAYGERPSDSPSKLNTFQDGIRILRMIGRLVRIERPLAFFSCGFFLMAVLALLLAAPLAVTYLETGLVPRLPTAVLATGLMLLAFLSLVCGLILETVTRGRQEAKRMVYLSIPAPPGP
ncbi:glycosyltransferase [Enterovirga sp.]|uniref:glycosyltransferase n=1 Tax=Enterovirga sp. TaxID=2026350 RepID=UPI002BB03B87|nr:glycosyltransferase [Enterovirga sp.]HMO27773.1 glycosyltransferase [Enterovirga sp.]